MKKEKEIINGDLNPTSHITPPTSQRGITLIALVITIIVMLILVAVTISMAVNGGLFEYAGKAVNETKGAITNEQQLADLQEGMTVDELINKVTTEEQKTITFKIDDETYTAKEGTTWAEWVSSTEGDWTVAEDGKIAQGTTKFIGYKGVPVTSNSPIDLGKEYVTIIVFTMVEQAKNSEYDPPTEYIAEEGMSWADWINSADYDSGDLQVNSSTGKVNLYGGSIEDVVNDSIVYGTDPIIAGREYFAYSLIVPE